MADDDRRDTARQALYRSACAEGVVNLYAGGPRQLHTEAVALFEQQHPGVRVDLCGGYPSEVLTGRIDHQRREGRLEADMAMLQTVQDFERWKSESALLPISPDGFEKIPSAFKDDDGFYVGIQIYALTYAFNTGLVARSDVPRAATDFLDPRYCGKIILGYPSADEVVLYLMATLVTKYGWEFMGDLMKNKPKFIMGHAGIAQKIAHGEYALTFDAAPPLTLTEKARGLPTDIAFPESDPIPVWAQTAGIFAGCPHPNAAKLYLDWYLRPEQQLRFTNAGGYWSPRSDVATPQGFKPIFEYEIANDFRRFIMDAPRVADLKRRFDGYTGSPHGLPHM